VIDEIGEGDVFGMWSLLGKVAPSATVRASEDTLCYLIPADLANDVLRTGAGSRSWPRASAGGSPAWTRPLRAEVDPLAVPQGGRADPAAAR
jgi:CBS domain-containing protein